MWQEILAIVVPILVAALCAATPVIIAWLKSQKYIQLLHLEDLMAVLVPQVVEWVEWWAEQLVKNGEPKPASNDKLIKALSILEQKVPAIKSEAELRMRIETALQDGGYFDKEESE